MKDNVNGSKFLIDLLMLKALSYANYWTLCYIFTCLFLNCQKVWISYYNKSWNTFKIRLSLPLLYNLLNSFTNNLYLYLYDHTSDKRVKSGTTSVAMYEYKKPAYLWMSTFSKCRDLRSSSNSGRTPKHTILKMTGSGFSLMQHTRASS